MMPSVLCKMCAYRPNIKDYLHLLSSFSLSPSLPWALKNNQNTATVVFCKDTRNCQEKMKKISHLKPNQLAPSIYIMKELCFFSLDQWEIRIHLLWEKCFNIPHHSDPHLNQTKFNELLPLTIADVLTLLHHPRDPCSLHDMTDCYFSIFSSNHNTKYFRSNS